MAVGTARVWNIVMSPLRDAGEQVTASVLVLDDLTEQHEREAQLAHVRRYLPLALVENIRSEDLSMLGGQEREITVLFADVRGFTTFSEQLEPERLMEIINKYLSVASDAVNLYEGVVDKYMGDAVTGLVQYAAERARGSRAAGGALGAEHDLRRAGAPRSLTGRAALVLRHRHSHRDGGLGDGRQPRSARVRRHRRRDGAEQAAARERASRRDRRQRGDLQAGQGSFRLRGARTAQDQRTAPTSPSCTRWSGARSARPGRWGRDFTPQPLPEFREGRVLSSVLGVGYQNDKQLRFQATP